jgi:hypothetical protein
LTEAQSAIARILTNKNEPDAPGLNDAYTNLATVLRVVEYSDRAVPSQAIAAHDEASREVKARTADWTSFKQTKLVELDRRLQDAGLAPITISEIDREVEYLMTR